MKDCHQLQFLRLKRAAYYLDDRCIRLKLTDILPVHKLDKAHPMQT